MSGSNGGHTLTSGTFGTVPRRGGVSSPRGPYGSAAGFFLRFRGSGPFLNLACGDPADHDGGTDHIGGTLLAFGASGHQLIPLNSTSINRVFGYFLRKARRASLRPAENPPSSASGLSLKNEAISPPLSSKMRTDIRTPDPLLPMKIPNALPVSIQQLVRKGAINRSINSN